MNKADMTGMKLHCGEQDVTKEHVEAAISDYKKKIHSPEFQKELKEFSNFITPSMLSPQQPNNSSVKKHIEYYEFPNGDIVKRVHSDSVYRFNAVERTWKIDHSLTTEFEWDRPYGEPCEHLRQKADISCDLPPFPDAGTFIPGNTVFVGAYPQKSPYDFSPIEWIVLDTDGASALCISKYCLVTSGYCDPKQAYGIHDGSIYPKAVFQMGEIQFHGRNCYHTDFTIRPCIQIKL